MHCLCWWVVSEVIKLVFKRITHRWRKVKDCPHTEINKLPKDFFHAMFRPTWSSSAKHSCVTNTRHLETGEDNPTYINFFANTPDHQTTEQPPSKWFWAPRNKGFMNKNGFNSYYMLIQHFKTKPYTEANYIHYKQILICYI